MSAIDIPALVPVPELDVVPPVDVGIDMPPNIPGLSWPYAAMTSCSEVYPWLDDVDGLVEVLVDACVPPNIPKLC